MSDYRRKFLLVVPLSLLAVATVAFVLGRAESLFDFVTLPSDDAASRLVFVVRWLFLPGFMLFLGVQFAARRGFYPDAIDGTRFPTNNGLEINLRYNQNTLEQVVLAAIAWTNVALVIDHQRLILIPAMAFLFVIGRITFWIGYLWRPVARTYGMILTALPTIGSILWLLAHWANANTFSM